MNMQYLDEILSEDNCDIIDEVLDAVKLCLPKSYNLLDVYVWYDNWTCSDDTLTIDIESIAVLYTDDEGELHTKSLRTDLYSVEVECDADYLDKHSGSFVSAFDDLL